MSRYRLLRILSFLFIVSTAAGVYGSAPSLSGVTPYAPNVVRVVDLENTMEVEPNDTRQQASPANIPGTLNGVIERPGDVDHFKFSAKKGQRFDVRVYARNILRSPLDSVLVVRRANGAAVGSNDDSGGPDSYYRCGAAIGTWPIIVTGSTTVGGGRVEAATQMAELTISDSFFAFTFEKAAAELGQETELVVNVENKIPFDGEAEVRLLGLPANTSTTGIDVYPPDIDLNTNRDYQKFIVVATRHDGVTVDVTAEAAVKLLDDQYVRLEGHTVYPVADGETKFKIEYQGHKATAPVAVRDASADRPISFHLDVMPVFMRSGCDVGSCHGAARGKDGFRPSLFGFDPKGDY